MNDSAVSSSEEECGEEEQKGQRQFYWRIFCHGL
jgi:hypothetical protein